MLVSPRLRLLMVLLPLMIALPTRAAPSAPFPGHAPLATASLEGVIRDAATQLPLAGAQVHLVVPTEGPPPVVSDTLVTGIVSYETVTDAQGTYRLDGVNTDTTYILQIRAFGYTSLVLEDFTLDDGEARQLDVDLSPRPVTEVSGRVAYDATGEPVADALVLFRSSDAFGNSARTGADGTYSTLVPDGLDYVAMVYKQGADSAYVYREFFDDAADVADATRLLIVNGAVTDPAGVLFESLDFRIPDLDRSVTTTVSGRVTDAEGTPLGGALVTVFNYFGFRDLQRYTAETAADGSYTVTIQGPYRQQLQARADLAGYRTEFYAEAPAAHLSTPIAIDVEAPTASGIDFTLAPIETPPDDAPALTGTVTDAQGAPLTDVMVTATQAASGETTFAHTGPDGAYVLPDLVGGLYYVLFTADGFAPTFAGGARTWSDAAPLAVVTRTAVDLRLERLAATSGTTALTGRVRTTDGVPASGVLVTADGSDGTVLGHALTTEKGRYRIEGLPEGEARVSASGTGLTTATTTLQLQPGEDLRLLDLRVAAAQRTARDGEPRGPNRFALEPAYPNPFRTSLFVAYTLTEPGPVTLAMFDVLGRQVRTLQNGGVPAGRHTVRLDAEELPSGTYFVRLMVADRSATRAVVLLR